MKKITLEGYEKGQSVFFAVLICLLTCAVLTGMGVLLQFDRYQLVRNAVLGELFCLITVFLWFRGAIMRQLSYDNAFHPGRFFSIYLLGLAGAAVFSRIPDGGWAFLTFYIVLALFSNPFTGLSAGTTLLACTMFLSGSTSFSLFMAYFIGGLIGISLFHDIDEKFKIGIPLFLSLLLQSVSIFANQLLMQNKYFTIASCIIPIVNILANFILLFFILQIFSSRVLLTENMTYQMVDDPEFELMTRIRKISSKDYFHAVHTAYLTDRICTALHMNVYAAKCAAYYFRADRTLQSASDQEDEDNSFEGIVHKYHIPEYAIRVMMQLRRQQYGELEKESTVVLLCENVITALQYFADQKAVLSQQKYETLINSVLDKKIDNGALNQSKISIYELRFLREQLLKEKLYYDFMCNNRN